MRNRSKFKQTPQELDYLFETTHRTPFYRINDLLVLKEHLENKQIILSKKNIAALINNLGMLFVENETNSVIIALTSLTLDLFLHEFNDIENNKDRNELTNELQNIVLLFDGISNFSKAAPLRALISKKHKTKLLLLINAIEQCEDDLIPITFSANPRIGRKNELEFALLVKNMVNLADILYDFYPCFKAEQSRQDVNDYKNNYLDYIFSFLLAICTANPSVYHINLVFFSLKLLAEKDFLDDIIKEKYLDSIVSCILLGKEKIVRNETHLNVKYISKILLYISKIGKKYRFQTHGRLRKEITRFVNYLSKHLNILIEQQRRIDSGELTSLTKQGHKVACCDVYDIGRIMSGLGEMAEEKVIYKVSFKKSQVAVNNIIHLLNYFINTQVTISIAAAIGLSIKHLTKREIFYLSPNDAKKINELLNIMMLKLTSKTQEDINLISIFMHGYTYFIAKYYYSICNEINTTDILFLLSSITKSDAPYTMLCVIEDIIDLDRVGVFNQLEGIEKYQLFLKLKEVIEKHSHIALNKSNVYILKLLADFIKSENFKCYQDRIKDIITLIANEFIINFDFKNISPNLCIQYLESLLVLIKSGIINSDTLIANKEKSVLNRLITQMVARIKDSTYSKYIEQSLSLLLAYYENLLKNNSNETYSSILLVNIFSLFSQIHIIKYNAPCITNILTTLNQLSRLGVPVFSDSENLARLFCCLDANITTKKYRTKDTPTKKAVIDFIKINHIQDDVSKAVYPNKEIISFFKKYLTFICKSSLNKDQVIIIIKFILNIVTTNPSYHVNEFAFSDFLKKFFGKFADKKQLMLIYDLIKQVEIAQPAAIDLNDSMIKKLEKLINPATISVTAEKKEANTLEIEPTLWIDTLELTTDCTFLLKDEQLSQSYACLSNHQVLEKETAEFYQTIGLTYITHREPKQPKYELRIEQIPAIQYHYGLVADEFIPGHADEDKMVFLGEYTGEVKNDEENNYSTYAFKLDDDNIVDAIRIGNELRFINSTFYQPNVKAVNKTNRNGSSHIIFYAIKPIFPQQQLLITYGDEFSSDGFLSMGPHHHSATAQMGFVKNNAAYLPHVIKLSGPSIKKYQFYKLTQQEAYSVQFALVPKIFELIFNHTDKPHQALAELLAHPDCDPNLPVVNLGYDDQNNHFYILDSHLQQEITPLMHACYKGDIAVVKLLLDHAKIDVNRQTLHTRMSAIAYLFDSKVTEEIKLQIFKLLINRNSFIGCVDYRHFNLLDYCLKYNHVHLANLLLTYDECAENIFTNFLADEIDNWFSVCINEKKFEILKIYLQHTSKELLFEKIIDHYLPLVDSIAVIETDSIQQILSILNELALLRTNQTVAKLIANAMLIRTQQATEQEKARLKEMISEYFPGLDKRVHLKKNNRLNSNTIFNQNKPFSHQPSAPLDAGFADTPAQDNDFASKRKKPDSKTTATDQSASKTKKPKLTKVNTTTTFFSSTTKNKESLALENPKEKPGVKAKQQQNAEAPSVEHLQLVTSLFPSTESASNPEKTRKSASRLRQRKSGHI